LNSQSLNPYSYILNNPLSSTDPTGYICSTGTRIKSEGGPSCDDLGVISSENNSTWGSNSPANYQGGNRSITIKDGDGSIKTTNFSVTNNADGTRAYGQVGATSIELQNGGQRRSETKAKKPRYDEQEIAAEYDKNFRDPIRQALSASGEIFDFMYDLADPCMGVSSASGCGAVVAGTTVGVSALKAVSLLVVRVELKSGAIVYTDR